MADTQRTLHVVIERDPESGWYVGEVVELPGCYTQAPDLETLEANVAEAVRAYLDTEPLPEPFPDYIGTHQIQIPA